MVKLRVLDRIADVSAAQWNALVSPDDSPFLDHGYLAVLESSGSVGREAGYVPKHLTVWEGDRLVGASPAYLKYGEHTDQMIDWIHELAVKNELPYYPVVVLGTPFSTVPSRKFLTAGDAERDQVIQLIADGARELARGVEYPVVHVWSCTDDEAESLARLGFNRRAFPYYAWKNDSYTSFDDYLGRMRNDKRRSGIRKDRKRVREAGVVVRTLRGADITDETLDILYRCHKRTVDKYDGGSDVFNQAFFRDLGTYLGHRLEVFMAEKGSTPVAASFNCLSRTTLYPKQWGALEEIPFLHFEVTWYHAMEEAIARKLSTVDAGGPSETKLVRGFLPVDLRHGATWCGDEDLHAAFGKLVAKERVNVDAEIADALARSPFKS